MSSSSTRKSLTALLEDYEEALEDTQDGMSDTSLTEDKKKALRDAVTTAAKELTDALTDMGIEQSEYTSLPDGAGSQAPIAPTSTSTQDNDSSSTAKTGFLKSILNWLGSFIK